MLKRKMLKNLEIYSMGNALLEHMQGDFNLPVKVNFYLQKNMNTVIGLARGIEESRGEILRKYGTPNEDGTSYHFDDDKINIAQNELNDLFDLEQEVKIYMLKLDWFDDVELSSDQVNAIMFMIEDEEDEEE